MYFHFDIVAVDMQKLVFMKWCLDECLFIDVTGLYYSC